MGDEPENNVSKSWIDVLPRMPLWLFTSLIGAFVGIVIYSIVFKTIISLGLLAWLDQLPISFRLVLLWPLRMSARMDGRYISQRSAVL